MEENTERQERESGLTYTLQVPALPQPALPAAPPPAAPVAVPAVREPTAEERAFGERITDLLNAITDLSNTLALHDFANVQDEGVKDLLRAAREVVKAAWKLQKLMREAAARAAARQPRPAQTGAPQTA
ncbi:MAG: hypothetical protein QXE66_00225 [Desulfurococcaceae archaeon]